MQTLSPLASEQTLSTQSRRKSFRGICENFTQKDSCKCSSRSSELILLCMLLFSVSMLLNRNNFFIEKNPTIVPFPAKNLEMSGFLPQTAIDANPSTKYDLVAAIVHEGQPEGGTYTVNVRHPPSGQWFQIQVRELSATEGVVDENVGQSLYFLPLDKERNKNHLLRRKNRPMTEMSFPCVGSFGGMLSDLRT